MKRIQDRERLNALLAHSWIREWFTEPEAYQFQLICWEKGEYLLDDGRGLDQFIFCVEGSVKICSFSENGKVFTLTSREAPYFLGGLEWLSGTQPENYIIASDKVLAVTLDMEKHRAQLENDLTFYKRLSQELALKWQRSTDDYRKRSLFPLEARLLSYLQIVAGPGGELDCAWNEVSQLMCVSYRHLMRTLQQFCEEGILKHSSQRGRYILVQTK